MDLPVRWESVKTTLAQVLHVPKVKHAVEVSAYGVDAMASHVLLGKRVLVMNLVLNVQELGSRKK